MRNIFFIFCDLLCLQFVFKKYFILGAWDSRRNPNGFCWTTQTHLSGWSLSTMIDFCFKMSKFCHVSLFFISATSETSGKSVHASSVGVGVTPLSHHHFFSKCFWCVIIRKSKVKWIRLVLSPHLNTGQQISQGRKMLSYTRTWTLIRAFWR